MSLSAGNRKTWTLRARTEADESVFAVWFGEEQARHLPPLPLEARQALLDLQYRGRAMTYAAKFPRADDQAICWEGKVVGRLTVDRQRDSIHLVDIILSPETRGQGLGTEILTELIEEANAKGAAVLLEVRPGNPAQRLYERLGFRATQQDSASVYMVYRR